MMIKNKLNCFVTYLKTNRYTYRSIFVLRNLHVYFVSLFRKQINLSTNHISLSVGHTYQIPFDSTKAIKWISDNQYVKVNERGEIFANENKEGAESNAIIRGYHGKKQICEYKITIVDWITHLSHFEIKSFLPSYRILARIDDAILFSIFNALYKTNDSFLTKSFISMLPVIPASSMPMIATPKGYILSGEHKIFWSKNLQNWECIASIQSHGLAHCVDYYYDQELDICYVYYAEYSCISANRHKLYRGTISSDYKISWETILDFYSIDEYKKNVDLLIQTARHIHVVFVDRHTGYLWIGVGDSDEHSKILVSTDNGNNFKILGMGSQEWRTLAIWFTSKYIYWNMDTHEPQKIFRIEKDKLDIQKLNDYHTSKEISKVYCHHKELVADLHNGSMFHILEAITEQDEKIVIMAATGEGAIRDKQGRLFGIKENKDYSVSVQELISLSPRNHHDVFTQLRPVIQDSQGYLYFSTRNLIFEGVIKAKLFWKDVQ